MSDESWEVVTEVSGELQASLLRNLLEAQGIKVFLNQEGELCEGSFSNLFLIRDNSLLTPPLTAGLLPGITRNFILKSANQLNLGCREVPLYPKDLGECDGAFLTSSLMEIAPLLELDKYKFDADQTAQTRNLLQDAFREETA